MLLALEGLTRHYGGVAALTAVDAQVPAGGRVLLVGPNGAGKSTLLRLVAGLATPSAGHVSRDGAPLERDPAWRARLGYLDHRGFVYGALTGRENLRLAARMTGAAADVDAALEAAGLTGAADRRVAGYSRGMRQRLGLARALLHDPELLLLDEPLVGLDRAGAADVLARLRGWADAGGTLLVASHHVDRWAGLVDTAWLLEGGRLVRTLDVRGMDGAALAEACLGASGTYVEAADASSLPVRDSVPLGRVSASLPGFGSVAAAVLGKELRLEWRTKSALPTMLLFALLVLFVFTFALPGGANAGTPMFAAGVLWVAVLFGAVIGCGQLFGGEEASGGMDALALAPADPAAIYLGKVTALLVQILVLAAAVVPAFCLLYHVPLFGPIGWRLVVLAVLGTMGIAAVGGLLSAMTVHVASREFLLPLLLLPLTIPLLIALVRGTTQLLHGAELADLGARLWVVISFDLVFAAVSTMLFEFVLGGD